MIWLISKESLNQVNKQVSVRKSQGKYHLYFKLKGEFIYINFIELTISALLLPPIDVICYCDMKSFCSECIVRFIYIQSKKNILLFLLSW